MGEVVNEKSGAISAPLCRHSEMEKMDLIASAKRLGGGLVDRWANWNASREIRSLVFYAVEYRCESLAFEYFAIDISLIPHNCVSAALANAGVERRLNGKNDLDGRVTGIRLLRPFCVARTLPTMPMMGVPR